MDLGEHVLELSGLVAVLQMGDGDFGRTSLRESMDLSELLVIVRLEFAKVLGNGEPLLLNLEITVELNLEITVESMAVLVLKVVLSVCFELVRVVLLLIFIFEGDL